MGTDEDFAKIPLSATFIAPSERGTLPHLNANQIPLSLSTLGMNKGCYVQTGEKRNIWPALLDKSSSRRHMQPFLHYRASAKKWQQYD
jgi:hypothetical protein